MRSISGPPQRELARIAGRQHGVLTAAQLLDAGLTGAGIQRRVDGGLLHRQYRGVFRLGHRAPSTEAHYLAAVFACGAGAALSGQAAAHLYGLLKGRPPAPEVTTPTKRRVRGVIPPRARRLDPRDIGVYRGIPITTVARTVIDLAGGLGLEDLGRACHEAQVRHRLTQPPVAAALARRPNAP